MELMPLVLTLTRRSHNWGNKVGEIPNTEAPRGVALERLRIGLESPLHRYIYTIQPTIATKEGVPSPSLLSVC